MNRNSGDWGCLCIFQDHFFTIGLTVPKSALFLKYDEKWGNFSHCDTGAFGILLRGAKSKYSGRKLTPLKTDWNGSISL